MNLQEKLIECLKDDTQTWDAFALSSALGVQVTYVRDVVAQVRRYQPIHRERIGKRFVYSLPKDLAPRPVAPAPFAVGYRWGRSIRNEYFNDRGMSILHPAHNSKVTV